MSSLLLLCKLVYSKVTSNYCWRKVWKKSISQVNNLQSIIIPGIIIPTLTIRIYQYTAVQQYCNMYISSRKTDTPGYRYWWKQKTRKLQKTKIKNINGHICTVKYSTILLIRVPVHTVYSTVIAWILLKPYVRIIKSVFTAANNLDIRAVKQEFELFGSLTKGKYFKSR